MIIGEVKRFLRSDRTSPLTLTEQAPVWVIHSSTLDSDPSTGGGTSKKNRDGRGSGSLVVPFSTLRVSEGRESWAESGGGCAGRGNGNDKEES